MSLLDEVSLGGLGFVCMAAATIKYRTRLFPVTEKGVSTLLDLWRMSWTSCIGDKEHHQKKDSISPSLDGDHKDVFLPQLGVLI